MKSISVIIPHFHDLSGLDVCLRKLGAQTYPLDYVEVIVADNNSPEGAEAVAKVIDNRARLVIAFERGAGPARNVGVAASTGEILAFTDSDCQPEPEWLREGVGELERYDFVGGQVRILVSDPLYMTPTEAFESVFAFDFETYVTKKGFAGAGNLFCGRTVFDSVGGFCSGISEDVNWSHRARDKGLRIGYAPKAIVGHPARRTWTDLRNKWSRLNAESYGLMARQRLSNIRWTLRTLALPLSAIVHTRRVLVSANLYTLRQRLSALHILYKLRIWRLGDSLRLLAKTKP